MRLPTQSGKLDRSERNLRDSLNKLKICLGFSDGQWAEVLALNSEEYSKFQSGAKSLSSHSLSELALRLDISLEKLMTGQLDIPAIVAKHFGNRGFMPERYATAALSKRRTSIHLLDYIEEFYGWPEKARIMRYLHVSEDLFNNPDDKINIHFITDLCDYLARNGYTDQEIYTMGSYSVYANRSSELAQLLALQKSPKHLHERVFSDLIGIYYDQNFHYQLTRLEKDSCVVQARPNPDLLDQLRALTVGNSHICKARAGCFSSLAGYMGLPFSRVEETECVHWGNDCCRFEVDFTSAVFHFENRLGPAKQPFAI